MFSDFLSLTAIATALLAASTSAAPFQHFGNHNGNHNVNAAALARVQQPTFQGDTLSRPTGRLIKVVLGVGSQLYKCADQNSAPTRNGAKAFFLDGDYLAINNQDLLHTLSPTFLHSSVGLKRHLSELFSRTGRGLNLVGEHFFLNPTSPVFVFKGTGRQHKVFGKANEMTPAPPGADTGVKPNNFGAVAWLNLNASEKVKDANEVKHVYRLVTAGGVEPKTCAGRPKDFGIPYAAEYWFYTA